VLHRCAHLVVLAALTLSAAACKKSTATNPSPTPTVTTITITASGASPRDVTIAVGDRVRFVNNDSRSHNMTSDPHPEHTECPEINQAGFLTPNQSRETGNFVQARTCGYHDHDNPNNVSLTGRITIR
jgi:plastocyanin